MSSLCVVIAGLLGQQRTLVPLTTSLGGLIAKEWILIMQQAAASPRNSYQTEHYSDVLRRIPGIVFFGVPHRGANFVSALNGVTGLAGIASEFCKTLGATKQLEQQCKEFQAYIDKADLSVLTFVESKRPVVGYTCLL